MCYENKREMRKEKKLTLSLRCEQSSMIVVVDDCGVSTEYERSGSSKPAADIRWSLDCCCCRCWLLLELAVVADVVVVEVIEVDDDDDEVDDELALLLLFWWWWLPLLPLPLFASVVVDDPPWWWCPFDAENWNKINNPELVVGCQ